MQFLEKPLANVKKHRDIKFAATFGARRNDLESETTIIKQIFFWRFINHRNEKNTNIRV